MGGKKLIVGKYPVVKRGMRKNLLVRAAASAFLIAVATMFAAPVHGLSISAPFNPKKIENPVSKEIYSILVQGSGLSALNIKSAADMERFYNAREFKAAWMDRKKASKQALELLSAIDESKSDGLSPGLYHKAKIDELMKKVDDDATADETAASLDLLFTDAFLCLASNLKYGLVNPLNRNVRYYLNKGNPDLVTILQDALDSKKIKASLQDLPPKITEYLSLKQKLAEYRNLQLKGGWKLEVPSNAKFRVGEVGPSIGAIKNRLTITGDLDKADAKTLNTFDADLEKAIMAFQKDHGLADDGVIGKKVIEDLEAPVSKRITQISTNLDRLRSYSSIYEAPRYIIVNVPAFEVKLVENQNVSLRMKAIVGQLKRKTPLMSEEMTYIVFSPKWYVPTIIAVEDKLPIIRKDPGYIKRSGMRMYAMDGSEKGQVDPETVDWTQYGKGNFPYRIVQDPGAGNALGRIKFMFPNSEGVYLHDTPSKSLFNKEVRIFSSGCIRIEKPVDLAEVLLKDKGDWPRDRITKEMTRGAELFVNLTEPLPIHLMYLTAWMEGSRLQFRRDVYGYDGIYEKLFNAN